MRANEWNMLLKTTSRKNLLIHNSKRERIENDMAEKNEIKLCCVWITKELMSTYYYHFYFFYWWKNVHVFIFFKVKIKILWEKNSIVFQRNKKLLVCVFWHWKFYFLLWIVCIIQLSQNLLKSAVTTVWKSTIQLDHDFYGKMNIFSVKSTFSPKKHSVEKR